MAAIAVAAILQGCHAEAARPNFLLISIDTLRADHLGSYGYHRDTSPNLDRFADKSVRYRNAYAPAPWTLPSHVAMLTGTHPFDAGISDYRSSIPPDVPSLAEELSRSGYESVAFVDAPPGGLLGSERGFARGFSIYRHAPHASTSPYEYDVATTVDAALDWLRQRDSKAPFFLFFHTKSVHTTPTSSTLLARTDAPYDLPEPFGSRFLEDSTLRFSWTEAPDKTGATYLQHLNERIANGDLDPSTVPPEQRTELIDLYDGGIAYVDHHFQRLMDGLAQLGLNEHTIIVITADHGEAFLDHHFFLHKEPMEALLHIPLIVHDPREKVAAIFDQRASLTAVAPSLISLAGLPVPENMSGRVLPHLSAPDAVSPTDESQFSYFRFDHDYFYEGYALTKGPWRLLYHKLAYWLEFRTELYDHRSDPNEENPIQDDPTRTKEMLAEMLRRMNREGISAAPTIDLDDETIEHLRSLGYLT